MTRRGGQGQRGRPGEETRWRRLCSIMSARHRLQRYERRTAYWLHPPRLDASASGPSRAATFETVCWPSVRSRSSISPSLLCQRRGRELSPTRRRSMVGDPDRPPSTGGTRRLTGARAAHGHTAGGRAPPHRPRRRHRSRPEEVPCPAYRHEIRSGTTPHRQHCHNPSICWSSRRGRGRPPRRPRSSVRRCRVRGRTAVTPAEARSTMLLPSSPIVSTSFTIDRYTNKAGISSPAPSVAVRTTSSRRNRSVR